MMASRYEVPPKLFFQEGTPQLYIRLDDSSKKYQKFAQKVINALDYVEGIFHLEVIENDRGEIYFLEIGSRPGGTIHDVQKYLGLELQKAHIYSQMGKEVEFDVKDDYYAVIVMMSPTFNSVLLKYSTSANSIWVRDFDYHNKDELSLYQSFSEENSKEPYVFKKYIKPNILMLKASFIGDKDEVESDSKDLYTTLRSTIKIIQGPLKNNVYELVNKKWVIQN